MDIEAETDLSTLKTTSDPVARNAAALRLAEKAVPEAKAVLLKLIAKDDLRDQRGPLVHSLGYFDCSDQFGLLVNLVIDGNFEVAQEALEILELVDGVSADQADPAFEVVEAALDDPDIEDWRRSLLDDLLEMFD